MSTRSLCEEEVASEFPQKIHIYYASQTGQAESISKLIHENFTTNDPELRQIVQVFDSNFLGYHCISDYETQINEFWLDPDILQQDSVDCNKENVPQPKQLPIESLSIVEHQKKPKYLLIIVASTTGQGDPPEKAIKFFRWIRKLKRSTDNLNKNKINNTSGDVPKQFAHISYALLGLGDTNYDNFANFSKQLNKIFKELGASEFIKPAFADDAVGLEIVTEPFIENLNETIKKRFRQTNNIKIEKPIESIPTIDHDDQAGLAQLCNANDSRNSDQNSIKMNLNRPVVSSCVAISSSEKRLLSDVCRQLLEPSNHLAEYDLAELDVPKFTPKSSLISTEFSSYGCVYNQKNLTALCNKADLECLTMKEYLQQKAANKPSLHVGKVSLSEILSNHDGSNECCHRRKTVLECDVEYQFPNQSSGTNQIVDETGDKINDHPSFQPGDAFGFYTANQLIDVHQVLNSIKVKCPNVDGANDDDEEPILLWDYLKGNRKQAFIILNDQKTVVELLPYLMFGVDLRSMPKKLTLLQLSKYTGDEQQRRRLLELCSKQGNDEYQQLILVQNITICDILRIFDTCHPPLNVFLSQLMVAKPRYFSVSSLPKISQISANADNSTGDKNLIKCNFQFILSVSTNFSHTFMRTTENLLGLFSGKFFQHYNYLPKNFQVDLLCSNVWSHMESLHENVINGNIFYDNQDVPLCSDASFPCYLFSRVNQSFKLPMNQTQPLILISTGTGVSPFLCYLEALAQSLDNDSENFMQKPSEIFFIFGCRHPYQDFVHSDRIISMAKGTPKLIDHLCLCFSRCSSTELARFQNEHNIELCNDQFGDNGPSIKHVDQLIRLHGEELVDLIINRDATIFVCGNWKQISDGIIKAFCTILARFQFGNEDCDHNLPEAQKYIKDMKKNGRFIQDIWT